MYLRGCLSAFLSYPLSNLLILKGKKSDPTPPKSIPSHPSHPCALQCKASSYPGSPSNTLPLFHCVCSCVCSFTLRAYSFAHNFLYMRVFVCFSCNFISAIYASAGPWKAPPVWLKLAGGWSGSAAAKSRQLIAENATSCRIWRPCWASQLLRKIKLNQIHQPCLFWVSDRQAVDLQTLNLQHPEVLWITAN